MTTLADPTDPATATEPTPFDRNESGLVKGHDYPLRVDGRIDWFQQIPHEHIVFNDRNPKVAAAIEAAYGKPAGQLIYAEVIASGKVVDPRHILILLQGFVELADIRGYRRAGPATIIALGRDMVCATVDIEWEPNTEEPNGKTSCGEADATTENTGGFGYLTAVAGNRAYVRAVRRGLRIPVLGFDEIAKKDDTIPEAGNVSAAATTNSPTFGHGPTGSLQRAAQDCGFAFQQIKDAALARWNEDSASIDNNPEVNLKRRIENDPTTWEKWADVPPRDCLTLINLVKAAKAARAENSIAKEAQRIASVGNAPRNAELTPDQENAQTAAVVAGVIDPKAVKKRVARKVAPSVAVPLAEAA